VVSLNVENEQLRLDLTSLNDSVLKLEQASKNHKVVYDQLEAEVKSQHDQLRVYETMITELNQVGWIGSVK